MGRSRALVVAVLVGLAITAVAAARDPGEAWSQAGAAQAAATTDQFVRLTWMSFEQGAACSSTEAANIIAAPPDGAGAPLDLTGVRGLYCFAARLLPAAVVEGFAGVPIFQSGPHRDGKLQLASVQFGRYNPAFVTWAAAQLVPGARDAAFRKATQPIYDQHLRGLVRAYAAAGHFFDKHPNELARIAREYKSAIDAAAAASASQTAPNPSEGPARRLSDALVPVAGCLTTGGAGAGETTASPEYEPAAAAAAFWVRRSMDGTRGPFSAALTGLLQTYDAEYVPAICESRF